MDGLQIHLDGLQVRVDGLQILLDGLQVIRIKTPSWFALRESGAKKFFFASPLGEVSFYLIILIFIIN